MDYGGLHLTYQPHNFFEYMPKSFVRIETFNKIETINLKRLAPNIAITKSNDRYAFILTYSK